MLPEKQLNCEEHNENVTKPPDGHNEEITELCNMHRELMVAIKELLVSTNTQKSKNQSAEVEPLKTAWREVARVLDRVFLIAYSVAIILSLLWLLPKPTY